ncbi:MAG: sugar ABC transporter permease [Spirochaetes bacterium]|nr:sugar ABC transporter permease [Spirochaetota bacterium]
MAVRSARRRAHVSLREGRSALLFIAPFFLGFVLFNLLPLFYSVFLSLVDFNTLGKMGAREIIGLANYARALGDRLALASFARSFYFSFLYVAGIIVLSLFMALLLNRDLYLRTLSRTMIYMPYVANVIAIGIVWSIVLNPFKGPINALLMLVGVPEKSLPQWLLGVRSSLPTLAGIKVWQNLAFQTIVFMAALQDVPQELYECAQIDGAGWWRKLFRITLPLISPTTFFLVVVTVIGSFNSFAIVKALTNGGPGSATRIITLFIYDQAFRYSYYSYSNALACLLFLFILAVTLLQWRFQKRWVHY